MKITVVGGGGFRTPHVWQALAAGTDESQVEELVLYDLSEPRLARIDAVLKGLEHERGGGPRVRTTTSLIEAVDQASAVFCAIRVGGLEGRVVDETVPLREGVLGQETVGPGGISFALRTVPVMMEIARVISQRAPAAWFLNFTNPAGLVTEAIRTELGDRAIGICDSPSSLCARVAALLGYPGRELAFDYAGLNHLGWLLAVRSGGQDLLRALMEDDDRVRVLEEARLFGPRRLQELGMIPNEYLVYYKSPRSIVRSYRRAGSTRAEVLIGQQARFFDADAETPQQALEQWRRARDARNATYMSEAWQLVPDPEQPPEAVHEPKDFDSESASTSKVAAGSVQEPDDGGYATVAAKFLKAANREEAETLILNVANGGRLPGLDGGAVVEIPCSVSRAGVCTQSVGHLPPAQADLVARVKDVERTTVRAALEGSRSLALKALADHPVVPSLDIAQRILAGYLAAFPSLAQGLR